MDRKEQTRRQSRRNVGPQLAWDRIGITPLRFRELQAAGPVMDDESREAARSLKPRKKLLVVLIKVAFVEMMAAAAWTRIAAERARRAANAAANTQPLDNGAAA